jgi:hypothetical protein
MRFPFSELVPPRARTFRFLFAPWTLPTSFIGWVFAKLTCLGPPERVGGPAARGWLFILPPNKYRFIGAVALGHVIVAAPSMLKGEAGRWTLAHELAHTRQHDVLGPLYLPLHGLCQLLSSIVSWIRPIPGYPGTHAYNPLERGFIAVPYDALRADVARLPPDHPVLRAFGV